MLAANPLMKSSAVVQKLLDDAYLGVLSDLKFGDANAFLTPYPHPSLTLPHLGLGGLPWASHVPAMCQPCAGHVPAMCQPCASHVPAMCQPYGGLGLGAWVAGVMLVVGSGGLGWLGLGIRTG